METHTEEKRAKEQDKSILNNCTDNEESLCDSNILDCYLNQEKRSNQGEDADPINYHDELWGALGVFDGMGGSGASEYSTEGGETHTGAYLSSRFVCQSVESYIKQLGDHNIDSNELCLFIKKQLNQYAEKLDIKPSKLRSSIIRTLPTTMAMITFKIINQEIDINSYWCGDSRNYILSANGLEQISVDDIKSGQDPLENLRNDDALSNCISQDHDFTINNLNKKKSLPIILLSATDGCFGYYPSPMHFEFLLLDTLQKSNNPHEWRNNIIENLNPISGDDFSMSITLIGLSFAQWKNSLQNRYQSLYENYIKPINEKLDVINETQHKLLETKKELYDITTTLWHTYKSNYLK